MNLFKRGMIFVTFFTSCLGIALLLASLGTKQWVVAGAKRTSNPHESDGKVNFGLFEGKKELNVAYGWRTYEINVIEMVRTEPDFLVKGIWLATAACVCGGLLFVALSAVFAVINTASTPIGSITGVPGLYLWNSLSMVCSVAAVSLWLSEFFIKLRFNVMSLEDRENMWTSDGMAELGYSFWFVVGAAAISLANIVIIYIGTNERDTEQIIPVLEEKTNGAIMLY